MQRSCITTKSFIYLNFNCLHEAEKIEMIIAFSMIDYFKLWMSSMGQIITVKEDKRLKAK